MGGSRGVRPRNAKKHINCFIMLETHQYSPLTFPPCSTLAKQYDCTLLSYVGSAVLDPLFPTPAPPHDYLLSVATPIFSR